MASITTLPDFAVALTLLNQTQLQRDNPALYNILKYLIDANIQSQNTVVQTTIPAAIASVSTGSADVAPDGVTIVQQVATPSVFDAGLLRLPPRLFWWNMAANSTFTTVTVVSSGNVFGQGGSAIAPIMGQNVIISRNTVNAAGVNSNLTGTLWTKPDPGANGKIVAIYRWGNVSGTGTPLADIRIRLGWYINNLSQATSVPQNQAGCGIRYTFDDGTSPAQWVLEQFDGTTRTTSSKFGSFTLGHYYRTVLTLTGDGSDNVTLKGEVWDETAGTVATQTLAIASGTKTQTVQILQMGLFNNNGSAQTRSYDTISGEYWMSGYNG